MNYNISFKYPFLTLFNFLLLIFTYVLLFVLSDGTSYSWDSVVFFCSVVCILFNLYTMYRQKAQLSDFRMIFMLLTYLFMYGRIWLRYLELDSEIFWVLHKLFSSDILLKAGLYAVCCTQALFIGLFILGKNQLSFKDTTKESMVSFSGKRAIGFTAIALLFIAIPSRLAVDINSVISTAATGSYGSITVLSGPAKDFAHLIIPGIICLLEYKPKLRIIILPSIFAYYLVIMSLTGDRRYYVAGLLALIAYYFYKFGNDLIKKRKPLFIIRVFVLAIIFLNFLQVVRIVRYGGLVSLSEFLENYAFNIFVLNDVVFNVLAEFGISFYSIANIIDNVPAIMPYQYGMTLIKSIPSILPIGPLFSDIFSEASPSTIINPITGRPVGATLFGDLYANFSVFAVPVCLVIGLLIHRLMRACLQNRSAIGIVIYYTYFYLLINLVRCSIFEIVRPVVWCGLIPLVFYKMFSE